MSTPSQFDDKLAEEILPAHPLEKVFNLDPGSTEGFASGKSAIDKGAGERVVTDSSGVPITTPLIDPATDRAMVRSIAPSETELENEERAEDLAIDKHIEEVRVEALEAFRRIAGQADASDPRFTARLGEVAAQYLNIALNSSSTRIDAKYKRNKVKLAKEKDGGPKTLNNTLIVADRNQLLKLLADGQVPGQAPIDVTPTKVNGDSQ